MKSNSRRLSRALMLLRALLFQVVTTTVGISLATVAHAAPYPSPADWRNENIYQIFTDRFNDGDPSNNNVEAGRGEPYSPVDAHGIHGGDFKGIQQKLDYIKALGATAIWISPIPLNVGDGSSAYHGYAAQDFYALAPHWGTMTDLSNMVQAAHARGIRVILDIVCNHTGHLLTSTDPGWPNYLAPPAGYNLQYININNQHAFPFNPTNVIPPLLSTLFHTNGFIQDFGNTQEVVLGALDGLDDLATETTYVRTNMMNIYTNWVGRADFDGFRVDTTRHVDYGFWQYWCPQLHQFGTSIGKSNLFMFGEVWDSDSACGSYTGTQGGGPFKMDSTLDYPLFFTINPVFSQAYGNTSQIEDHYNAIPSYYDTNAWYRLVTFLDNHDNARFLSPGNANGDTNRLSVALEFLYTSRGIPCLYYGTEQAFNGTGDPNNREDMFAGQFQDPSALGDNFDEAHPLFQLVAKLNNFRRLYPALRTGIHNNLFSDPTGPGLFAYSRVLSNQEVFVCFNTASFSETLSNCPTSYGSGTILVNLLNTNDTIVVTTALGTNATPLISVPSMTAKIYIARPLVLPLDPAIISQSPLHAATCVTASAPIVLQFSKPMNTNSVQAAFSVTPATAGTFTWNAIHDTMTFTPSAAWPVFITNSVHLATNAVDSVSSNSLYAPFDTFFVTFTTNTISTSSFPPAGGTTSGGGVVNCGSNVTVCATPNACYSFLYWSQNGSLVSTTACYSFSATGNVAVVANFVNGQGSLATDSAADPVYASGSWTSSLNGGTGFSAWSLATTTPYSSCNGFFVSSSTASSPHAAPGIDVNGESWGMYANTDNCGEPTIATAFRAFATGPIQPSGHLFVNMQNGLNDNFGSAVGFTLRNGNVTNSPTDYTTGARLQFYLGGGDAYYTVVDASGARNSSVPLTYSGLKLIFTPGADDTYSLLVVSYGSGETNIVVGTLAGAPSSTLDSIALFNNDAGSDSPHDVFFNSLIVANVTPILDAINTSSSPVSGGTTSGGGTANCGSNVTVCATPNPCYSFGYWTRNGNPASASACYTFMATGSETVVANFVKGQGTVAIDSAADPSYGGPQVVWPNGSNGGVGFNPWALTQTYTNRTCDGFFANTSTNSDSPPHAPPGIDTNGKAWGLFANSDCGSAASAAAYRALGSGPVQVGGQVLLDMDNGSNDVANSAVGFALRNGNSTNGPTSYVNGARLQFYLAGGASVYRIIDGSGVRNTTVPLTYSGLHLIFTLGTNDTYTLTVVSYGTGLTNVITGTLAGTTGSTLDSIALFSSKNGSKPPHDVFFNSLAVVNVFPYLSTINASASPAGGGTITGGGSVSCGSNVTLCATPVSCNQFVNWTENGNAVATSPCLVFQANGSRTFVANFTNSTADTVGDGILDCWRQRYFGGTGTSTNASSCATCDADGTGQNNRFKFVAGLNPTNPASVFVLQIQTVPNQPTHMNLMYWPIATGCTYVVESTTNLVAGVWSPQAVSAPLTNGIQVTVMDPNATGPVKFYRVEIYNVITNIVIQDSVGDGISDSWRAQYFAKVDPTGATTNDFSCAACDADGTGQNNLFKYVTGLDPTNPASVFLLQITSSTNRPPQNNLLFTPLALGRSYTPQFTTNLASGSWFPLTTYTGPVTNNGSRATITDTNPIPPQEFYRIGISLP